MSFVAYLARFVLSAVFLWSSVGKFRDLDDFKVAVRNYELAPDRLSWLLSRGVPLVEVTLGVLLAVGVEIGVVSLVIAAALVVFSAAVTANLVRGRDIDCGCSGSAAPRKISWWHVGVNLILVGLAVFVSGLCPSHTVVESGWRWLTPGSLSSGLLPTLLVTALVFVIYRVAATGAALLLPARVAAHLGERS